ncbi:hypothetical protein AK812_SmicGene20710 [Symbiodinium microadriaticum]|uniref:Uncharacterized protein n=1 Tax=Symbiodinium microadriaticum TaxID=2951 RepID=A0A1Q9DP83_SYMMI|nr:hypothetical protein AK812_SmicGene20710 [Symbiodinium microadriaticum]
MRVWEGVLQEAVPSLRIDLDMPGGLKASARAASTSVVTDDWADKRWPGTLRPSWFWQYFGTCEVSPGTKSSCVVRTLFFRVVKNATSQAGAVGSDHDTA